MNKLWTEFKEKMDKRIESFGECTCLADRPAGLGFTETVDEHEVYLRFFKKPNQFITMVCQDEFTRKRFLDLVYKYNLDLEYLVRILDAFERTGMLKEV
jgi:hypothetical protein